jgi:hypothetical protein
VEGEGEGGKGRIGGMVVVEKKEGWKMPSKLAGFYSVWLRYQDDQRLNPALSGLRGQCGKYSTVLAHDSNSSSQKHGGDGP